MSERSAPRYTLIGLGILVLVGASAFFLAKPAQSDNAAQPANSAAAKRRHAGEQRALFEGCTT